MTPRRVEIERRKRKFKQTGDVDSLLKQLKIDSQELMPLPDGAAKALTAPSSGSRGGQPSPTFPCFLPLEVFDNTEFDCRTPEEWLKLGM